MILMSGEPGRVVALPSSGAAARTRLINLKGWGNFPTRRSIITKIGLSHQGNFQFLHTLGGLVYLYVFGDRAGQVQLQGVSFAQDCDRVGRRHGIEQAIAWYRDNRLAIRRTEVEVMVGTTPIRGFLVGLDVDTASHELNLFSFTYKLITIPEV